MPYKEWRALTCPWRWGGRLWCIPCFDALVCRIEIRGAVGEGIHQEKKVREETLYLCELSRSIEKFGEATKINCGPLPLQPRYSHPGEKLFATT